MVHWIGRDTSAATAPLAGYVILALTTGAAVNVLSTNRQTLPAFVHNRAYSV